MTEDGQIDLSKLPEQFPAEMRENWANADQDGDGAPIVIAKGQDNVALKIKEIAREAKIEIVEDKPLARAIYANCELGMEIPPELYAAVAEVLAYVYKLKKKAGYQK